MNLDTVVDASVKLNTLLYVENNQNYVTCFLWKIKTKALITKLQLEIWIKVNLPIITQYTTHSSTTFLNIVKLKINR